MTKRKRKIDRGPCTYCPNPATSDDHIPPTNLFDPATPPSVLISVPACDACNRGASKDDEYFRLWLVTREDLKGNPDREAVFPAVMRSLRRPEARRFADSLWRSTSNVERTTPSGLHMGRGILASYDAPRINRVAERIVKGLYFHRSGEKLPADYVVNVIHQRMFNQLDIGAQSFLAIVRGKLQASAPLGIGEGFKFWSRALTGENRYYSIWFLAFYGSLEFFCSTIQPPTE